MRNALIIVVSVVLLSLCPISAVSAADTILRISEMGGKVMVKAAPATEWADAKLGQPLQVNDAVKTGDDGKAVLQFADKSSVSLKQKTEITVEELVWEQAMHKVGITMNAGQLRTIVQKVDTPSEFKVKTANAVCGARGTIFYVTFADGTTKVYVAEGMIELLNLLNGESYTVIETMGAGVNQDGTTSPPGALSDDDKNATTSGYDTGMVAEPYSPPEGANQGDVTAPESTPETTSDNKNTEKGTDSGSGEPVASEV